MDSTSNPHYLDFVGLKSKKLLEYSGDILVWWLLLESYVASENNHLPEKFVEGKLLNVKSFTYEKGNILGSKLAQLASNEDYLDDFKTYQF
jgi:hypothetical protein